MQVSILNEVIVSARKLTLAYKRIEGQLPCPIALEPDPRRGWYGHDRPTGCISAASGLLGKPIQVFDFPPMGVQNPIAAFVRNYTDRAEIFISSTQNYCWKRLFVAKELVHLLTLDDSFKTPIAPSDVTGLLSDLINNATPLQSSILQAESFAYFAAIEILLPMEHAHVAAERLRDGASIADLARDYRIPRKAVEFRLTDPTVVDIFNNIYESHRFKILPYNPING